MPLAPVHPHFLLKSGGFLPPRAAWERWGKEVGPSCLPLHTLHTCHSQGPSSGECSSLARPAHPQSTAVLWPTTLRVGHLSTQHSGCVSCVSGTVREQQLSIKQDKTPTLVVLPAGYLRAGTCLKAPVPRLLGTGQWLGPKGRGVCRGKDWSWTSNLRAQGAGLAPPAPCHPRT